MVTHHGHTITDHVQTWSAVKNHAWYHGQPLAGEGGEERKSNGCSPIFYNGYFWRLVLTEQKLLDARDPFGGNVLKNPARYIFHCYGCTLRIVYHYANPLTAVFSHGCLQAGSIFGQK